MTVLWLPLIPVLLDPTLIFHFEKSGAVLDEVADGLNKLDSTFVGLRLLLVPRDGIVGKVGIPPGRSGMPARLVGKKLVIEFRCFFGGRCWSFKFFVDTFPHSSSIIGGLPRLSTSEVVEEGKKKR